MLLAAPIAFPFLVAVLCFALRERPVALRAASLAGALGLCAISGSILWLAMTEGPQSSQMSGWPAPFGITLVADALSGALLAVTAVAGAFTVVFGFAELDPGEERLGHHTLVHMLLAGISGAFVTGDFFNMYVWFEVVVISCFGLLVLRGGRLQIDGAARYVGLNLIATIAFLVGVGLLYGSTGALNMADLHQKTAGMADDPRLTVTAAFLLFAFAAKSAMFPLFFWLPASYHTPSFTVSAIFGALVTKVGVYALFRTFTLIYPADMPAVDAALIWGGALTMSAGVLGALAQTEIRRVLAFQVVASIGFMVVGIGIGTEAALAAAIFYLLQDILVKVNLFVAAWIGARIAGTESLPLAGGVWRAAPWLSALFLFPALALAGIPPFSGFWAKVLVVQAAFEAQYWAFAGLALIVGLLTLYSMGRVWSDAYWKARPEETPVLAAARPADTPAAAIAAAVGLSALILAIGVAPAPLIALAQSAAAQLVDPSAYVEAVLGGG